MKHLNTVWKTAQACVLLFLLCTWSYAAVLFSYDFGFKFPGKNDWDIKNFASGVYPSTGGGYLELKGNISGQQGENSNYLFVSKVPLKAIASTYETSIKISFSGMPKKRLSEEEEYQMAAGSGTVKSESKWGGGGFFAGFATRPPSALFGIIDSKEGVSCFFQIESQEVYVKASTKGNEKSRGNVFKKVMDAAEGKAYVYKIVYDSQKQTAYFYVDGSVVFKVGELGIKEGFVFFGVSGEEGGGSKTINFARFDELSLEMK